MRQALARLHSARVAQSRRRAALPRAAGRHLPLWGGAPSKMVKQRQAAVVAYLRRRNCKVEPSDREVVESNWPITKSAMRGYLDDLKMQGQGQGSG